MTTLNTNQKERLMRTIDGLADFVLVCASQLTKEEQDSARRLVEAFTEIHDGVTRIPTEREIESHPDGAKCKFCDQPIYLDVNCAPGGQWKHVEAGQSHFAAPDTDLSVQEEVEKHLASALSGQRGGTAVSVIARSLAEDLDRLGFLKKSSKIEPAEMVREKPEGIECGDEVWVLFEGTGVPAKICCWTPPGLWHVEFANGNTDVFEVDRVELFEEREGDSDPSVKEDLNALLTEEEREALRLSGKLAGMIKRIIGEGPTSAHDWAEAAHEIHALQHRIMAQAAARAYPDELRLAGQSFAKGYNEENDDV